MYKDATELNVELVMTGLSFHKGRTQPKKKDNTEGVHESTLNKTLRTTNVSYIKFFFSKTDFAVLR